MQPLWIGLIYFTLGILAFAVGSWLCLFRPRQVQRWAAQLSGHRKYMASVAYIKSEDYLWELRFTGIGAGIAAFAMVYMLFKFLFARCG
jgi:ABC-type microcin C transport system permease subunit YejB